MRIICQFSEGRDRMSSYTLYIQRRFHTSTTLVIIPYSRFASVKYPISPTLSTVLLYSFCRLLHPTKSSLRCVGGIFLLRSLVGARPLHLACARPFGRLKAPLGLSLLRCASQTRSHPKPCLEYKKSEPFSYRKKVRILLLWCTSRDSNPGPTD